MGSLFPGENGALESLRFAADKFGFGLWSLDIPTGGMSFSPNSSKLLGISSDNSECSYPEFIELMHPGDRSKAIDLDMIEPGVAPFDDVIRIVRKNGTVRSLQNEAEVLLNNEGKPERVMGIFRDVTRLREDQREAALVSERYHALIEAIDAIVWIARPDGTTIEHPDLEKIRGESATRFAGDRWKELFHPDDLGRTVASWEEAVRRQTPMECLHRVREVDGSYRWRKSRAIPVRDAQGNIREWMGATINIDEQVALRKTADHRAILTGSQIRAARGLLSLSLRELADRAGISVATLRRVEEFDGPCNLPSDQIETLKGLLCGEGVELLYPAAGNAAVRMK